MKEAASMAASLAVGDLAGLRKTRRGEAAAAAQKAETQAAAGAAAATATARILLDVFAVAEKGDYEVRFLPRSALPYRSCLVPCYLVVPTSSSLAQ